MGDMADYYSDMDEQRMEDAGINPYSRADDAVNDLQASDSKPIDGHSEAQTQSTIDSEEDELLGELYNLALNNHFSPLEWHEEATQAITNLIAQEANKARLETMQKVSDRLDDLHQGTKGAGWVHYGEMGEWLDDEIDRLTADKEQNNG